MNTIEKAIKKQQELAAQQHDNHHDMDESLIQRQEATSQYQSSNDHHSSRAAIDNEQRIQSEAILQDVPPQNSQQVEAAHSQEKKPLKNKSKRIILDINALNNMGYLVPNSTNTILNEEYRQIKRHLIKNIKGKNSQPIEKANIIQVSSAIHAEGKTFTAINLVLSLAMEMDFSILLVDADIIHSSCTKTLLNSTEPGLTDYLSGDIKDLSEVMLKTNIPKLTILPAGTRNLLSTELLSSDYMDKMIYEFSHRYSNRIVIFDSPPLLFANDARILAQKVGQMVFVVEQNKTEQSEVRNALALLDSDMVIGVVMNKSRSSLRGGFSGYYGTKE